MFINEEAVVARLTAVITVLIVIGITASIHALI